MSEQQIAEILRMLSPHARADRPEPEHCDRLVTILSARYCTDPPLSFRAIGQRLGMSGENVRRLQVQALQRIRRAFARGVDVQAELATMPRLYAAVYGALP